MTGFIVTRVLGKVTKINEGIAKTGKAWFRCNVACSIYDYASKKYETQYVNVVGFDKVAEAMKKIIKVDAAIFAEGTAKPGKPFKTNKGDEIQSVDLVARDWYLAGTVDDTRQAKPTETEEVDESDPFAN
jgi:hypothetical protein